MCFLEKTSLIDLQEFQVLPRELVGRNLVLKEKGKIQVPKILTVKKLNPLPFLIDVNFVLTKLQLAVEPEVLSQIISLYMKGENACPTALKNLKTERKNYLKICIIIKERLKIYKNYLVDSLINQRMKGWIEKNEGKIKEAFVELKNSNSYVETCYLDHVNSITEEKVKHFFRRKKNKIPICKLGCEKYYVSKYLMTSLGAINWFIKTEKGKLKSSLLNELKERSISGYIQDYNDFIDFEDNVVAPFVESLYNESQKSVLRQIHKKEQDDKFFKRQSQLISENKMLKSEATIDKNVRLFKEKYKGKVLIGLKKLAYESTELYLNLKHKKLDPTPVRLTTDNRTLFGHLSDSPCQNLYYLFWLSWEHHYAKRGDFEADLAFKMRVRRLELAKINYFPGYIQLPFDQIDDLMYKHRLDSPYYRLPEEDEHKKLFVINNNYYPRKSAFLGHVVLHQIKSGNNVNLVQLYKNNAINNHTFVTGLCLQKSIRKLCQIRGVEIIDKHKFVADISNNVNQAIPIRNFKNYNFMKFNNIVDEIVEDYCRGRIFIHQRDFAFYGRRYKDEEIEEYQKKFSRGNMGTGTYKKKFKLHKNKIRKECNESSMIKAINDYNDLFRFRYSLTDYHTKCESIYQFFKSISIFTIQSDIEEESCPKSLAYYQVSNNPVFNMFTVKIIKMLINFTKVYKITKSYNSPEIRKASKPLRKLEELLILRYRQLWDLIETNKVFTFRENEKYFMWLEGEKMFESLSNEIDFNQFDTDTIIKSLQELRLKRKEKEDKVVSNIKDDLKIKKTPSLIKIFKYKVALAFGVLNYLYNEDEVEEIKSSNSINRAEPEFYHLNDDKVKRYIDSEYE